MTVFVGGRRAARLETSWETGRTRRYDRDAFVQLGLLTADAADEIARWTQRFEDGYLAAARLGLSDFEWLDPDSAVRRFALGQPARGPCAWVPPSPTLVGDLADLLASAPSPRALEAFLFGHAEIDEVYGEAEALVAALTGSW